MNKNQIFIKTGTEYKKITKELLEESNLAELIGDKDKMVVQWCNDAYRDHRWNP